MDPNWYPNSWSVSCWAQLIAFALTFIAVLLSWKKEFQENKKDTHLRIKVLVAMFLFIVNVSLAVYADASKRIDSAKQSAQQRRLQEQVVDGLTNDGLRSLTNSTALRMSARYQAFEMADIHLGNVLATTNSAEEKKKVSCERKRLQRTFIADNMPLLDTANIVRVAMLVRIGPLTEEQKNDAFKSPFDFRQDTTKLYELANRLRK